MSNRLPVPNNAQIGRRFEKGCLLASLIFFAMNMLDFAFHFGGARFILPQEIVSNRIVTASAQLITMTIISAVPYILALLVSRKNSRLALALLILIDAVEFLQFLGSAHDTGLLAYPTLEALITSAIIALSLLMIRGRTR